MDLRQMRGLEIAKQKEQVVELTDCFLVKSQSGTGYYKVGEDFTCNCPDFKKRQATCKHAYAVRYYLQIEKQTPFGVESERVAISSKQAWKAYDEAQTHEITLFDELLKDLVENIGEPIQTFGRPRLSLRETAFCAIQKVYSQLSLRRAVSLFGNAVEKKQITHKPHFNAVSKFLNREDLTSVLERLVTITAAPLRSVETAFAVDSTGFRTTNFTQYANEKYGLGRKHDWLKAHACVGVKTNVVTSVVVGDAYSADSPQFQTLVARTASGGFKIEELSADKAYSSRDNLEAIADLGGTPYIPFKENAISKMKGSITWKKMFHFFQLHADEFYEHYHKRSNVESTFAAIKKKFGDGLKSRNKTAQKNELLCKIIAYNITVLIAEMHELGIKPEFV